MLRKKTSVLALTLIILFFSSSTLAILEVDNSVTLTENEVVDGVIINKNGVLTLDGALLSTPIVNIKGEKDYPGRLSVVNGGGVISPAFILASAGSATPLYGILDINGAGSRVFSEVQFGIAAGKGSVGYLTISRGGGLDTSLSKSNFIGISGGTGFVSVFGKNSFWNAKDIILGFGGGNAKGILSVSDNATIKAKSIQADTEGAGWVIIGDNNDSTSTGYIDTDSIKLSSENSYLIINQASEGYNIPWDISGKGSVIFKRGFVNLYGDNSISGYTIINEANIIAQNNNTLSQMSPLFMTQKGTLNLNGFSHTLGPYSSSGTTYFNEKANTAGTVLTVNGDYHGYGGTMVFNTTLGSDSSTTDFLHITGNADGGTNVKVNNFGGKGAKTVEGIKIITVDGAIAKGTEFRQNDRIVAGAYDYRLVQGGQGGNTNSWYLTSHAGGVDPIVPPVNPGPEPILPVDPVIPEIPEPPVFPGINISRPEAGSYISNLAASDMFITRMEDRGTEHSYTDIISGEKKQTSMWLRSEGRHIDSHNDDGQLSTDDNRYVLQIGGDIVGGSFSGDDNWRVGIMAGYGNSHSSTRSDITGYHSKGNVDGYSMGLYGTWFEYADRRMGAWVDNWLQYAWFRNRVQGEDLSEEKYDSDGLQASVETGYTFLLPGSRNVDYIIEPQAQIVWNGVKADEHIETNGSVVNSEGVNNLHTRMGIKGAVEVRTGKGADEIMWKPYVAVNWHHNTREYGVKMDDIKLSSSGTKNTGEMKLGVDGQLTPQLSIGGVISGQIGADDYRDLGGSLRVSYNF